ncbi:hypothetical protein Cgig2_006707 [Carnegiea gigantea]|uniref:FBD domain-containing protein n=1 Tax=Carnegiea gigantea TaxID=171969 RepID=A0A9Q1Q6B3_9CARY|nr:hypothetical protein Cgig2_006707 [Carnegiea gigantea]
MSRVSLRDRIKASVISRRWNEICLSPSRIQLHWHQGLVNVANCDRYEHFCPMYRDAFVNNVNRFLASFRGNHVRYFHLRFCLTSSSKDDIDEWIRFAIRMGVKVMGVVLYCQTGTGSALRTLDDDDSELSFEDDQYVMGAELFDTAQCNLKCLQLCGCNLRPDFAKYVSALKSLSLCLSFLAQYDLQTMLSGLPRLVDLLFDTCTLPQELSLSCLPSLKKFRIKYCRGVEQIYLSNVNLVFLSILGKRAIKGNLVGAPNLKTFCCSATSLTMPSLFKRIPEEAPMLETFCVSYCGKSDDCVPNCLKVFNGVTRLEWYFLERSRLGIAKMIRNTKNLEEHNLVPVNYKPEHLTFVALRGFDGASGQIDFVLYLLEHAVMLKQLAIVSAKSWGEGAQQDFLSKIQGLREDVEVTVR